MNTKCWDRSFGSVSLGLLAVMLIVSACGQPSSPAPTLTPLPTPTPTSTSTSTPTPLPSATIPPTVPATPAGTDLAPAPWKDFQIADFEAIHSPVNGDANQYLIFGNIPVSPPSQDLSPDLARFLGRWEGYDYLPPVAKDNKGVLVIQQISGQGGKAYLWGASILQNPFWVKEIDFKVVPGTPPAIQWSGDLSGGPNGLYGQGIFRLTYDRAQDRLVGSIASASGGSSANADRIEFGRGQSYYVYKDYARYFADHSIYPKDYRNKQLQEYGQGYLVYLPLSYDQNPGQKWPLIFFLIGTGERGEDPFPLAKHGPFQMILQKGSLPFIIVAPMLHVSTAFRSFPENYLDGALEEVLADYRIDPQRVYLTGLSMGGEATYRYALHRPEAFAALAPFAAFNPEYVPSSRWEGFKPFTLPMDRIKDIPVWAFHGSDDPVIPLAAAQRTVDDLRKAGGNVKFTILQGYDHNAWSEAYLDLAFYDWFLQFQKLRNNP